MADIKFYFITVVSVLGGIGAILLVFSAIFTVIGALEHKRKAWAIAGFILTPVCLVYCAIYRDETKFQQKCFGLSFLLLALAYVSLSFYG